MAGGRHSWQSHCTRESLVYLNCCKTSVNKRDLLLLYEPHSGSADEKWVLEVKLWAKLSDKSSLIVRAILSESKDVTGFFVGILGTPTSLFSIWTTSPIEGRVLGSGCEHKRPTSNMVLISCMSYAHSNLGSAACMMLSFWWRFHTQSTRMAWSSGHDVSSGRLPHATWNPVHNARKMI